MTARIIVACGSGVATSQTVASKVSRLLSEHGIEANVEAIDVKLLKQHVKTADAYIAVVKTDNQFNVPVFDGVSFLTGMGQDAELERLIAHIKDL